MLEIWLPVIGGPLLLIACGELLVRRAAQVASRSVSRHWSLASRLWGSEEPVKYDELRYR